MQQPRPHPGIVVISRRANQRNPMTALDELGVERPADHIAVYKIPNLRRHVMLLSRQPLTDELRQSALGELNVEGRAMKHLVYPLPEGDEDNLVNRIVTEGWRAVADEAEVEVSPSRDDRPFIAQMGLLKNFDFEKLKSTHPIGDVMGFPLSKAILALTTSHQWMSPGDIGVGLHMGFDAPTGVTVAIARWVAGELDDDALSDHLRGALLQRILVPSPFGHVELSFAGGRTGIVDGYSAPAPQTTSAGTLRSQ